MNRVEGPSGPNKPTRAEKPQRRPPAADPKEKAQTPSDSIEFSDRAKKLAGDPAGPDSSREARVEAARRRLASGELDRPEAYEKAAEKLLRSGELGKVQTNDDGDAKAV